jgi:hypothetical protein
MALLLVSLALAACGGTSSETGASTSARTTASVAKGASASTARTTATAPASAAKSKAGSKAAGKPEAAEGLLGALRECIKSKGSKKCALPGGGGPVQHLHLQIPGGGAHAKALPGAPGKGTAGAHVKAPAIPLPGTTGSQAGGTPGKDAFAKFAACLRANGVPVQSASGSGASPPSPEVKAAESKCVGYLDGGA